MESFKNFIIKNRINKNMEGILVRLITFISNPYTKYNHHKKTKKAFKTMFSPLT
jgi:hypothetical protein